MRCLTCKPHIFLLTNGEKGNEFLWFNQGDYTLIFDPHAQENTVCVAFGRALNFNESTYGYRLR